jgi:3-oxoacyl-[acyl-carrier-protein] synthase II
MKRVVITGLGAVSPLGVGMDATWRKLIEGRSGISRIEAFDATGYRCRIAGQVKDWDPTAFIEHRRLKEMDRFTELALGAAALAVRDGGLELTEEERDRAGCFIGVGFGGLASLEKTKQTLIDRGPSRVSPYSIPAMIDNLAAGQVSLAHHLRGPSYSIGSACASGAHAIGEAAEWIRRGRAGVMVAGGAEATITPVGIAGFEAMLALSRRNDDPERASRPWDRGRDGFVASEGAAVMILEDETRARQRGARIYAEISGYGASSDAHHITHPPPSGEGAQRAIRMALDDAHLAPERIDYVNAHATSTGVGDREESRAIESVFGAHARDRKLWVSSTKSMTGHLLGAAGALESAICAMALSTGLVPPTINLEDPDPECKLDYVPNVTRQRPIAHALNNAFGFGGTNAALVLSRYVSGSARV